jgi:DnaJ family protein C protein 9
LYDEFGTTDDVIDIANAYEYFRDIYPKINVDMIEEYKKKYVGLEEEQQDVIDFYNKFNGDITKILEYIPFSNNEDVGRLKKIIEKCFEEGVLTKTVKYTKSHNKVKLIAEEDLLVEEDEEVEDDDEENDNEIKKKDVKNKNKKPKVSSMNDLAEQILKNKRKRQNDLENMEFKYEKFKDVELNSTKQTNNKRRKGK